MALILSGDTGPSFVQSAALPNGSVIQVQSSVGGTNATSTSTSYVSDGLTVSITPQFSTSKLFVTCTSGSSVAGGYAYFRILETVSNTMVAKCVWGNFSNSPQQLQGFTLNGWYTPGNVTTRTFQLQGYTTAGTRYINYDEPTVMNITVMEIKA